MRSRTSVVLLAASLIAVATIHLGAQRGANTAQPLDGLPPALIDAFNAGARVFTKQYTVADGLGPVFNDEACGDCHRTPAVGGASNRTVTRFGRNADGVFDPLVELGGSLIQSRGIGSVTTQFGSFTFTGERVPGDADITTRRRTTETRGLGLVDAVPDETWLAIARREASDDPATAGRPATVLNLATRLPAVGKFGWKAQVPTVHQFSGDALMNEAGVTNPDFPEENCPGGDCSLLDFNPAPALNDDGRDVDALTDFMRLLAPPARGPITDAVVAGEGVFAAIGCGSCHLPSIETGASTVAALNRVTFHPYSDFLLHDMGTLGDGIVQGQARAREMRTAPLWGLRSAARLLHDGSATTIEQAIQRHDGQGAAAGDRFATLDPDRLAALLAFLRSL
ncbi:MAG TPA: di-heme oxidoredictase family protein [Vicinamibacterales bacterium]|nr:di-heme oxidoredictase family protein [Vicinamibacterales bacterium]